MGSFVTLQTGENNTTVLTVHDGHVVNEGDREINSGETVIGNLDAEGNISTWSDSRPASPDELEIGAAAQFVVQAAGVAPTDATTLDTDTPLYHIVQPGENLFRIALLYDTSVLDIAQANGISDIRQIYVGQRLLIPHPGSGFVNAPGAGQGGISVDTAQPAPLINGVDCSRFVGTSPIGRLPYGPITLYWHPAPGATQYVLNFYTDTGLPITFRMTKADETNISLDSSELGIGRNFLWDVQALRNGQLACITPRIAVLRDEAPAPPISPPVSCPTTVSC